MANMTPGDELEDILRMLWSMTWPLLVVLSPIFAVAFCSVPHG